MADPHAGDRVSLGQLLVGAGVALPIVAMAFYLMACPIEPCGLGGPGTCMFGHSSCALNPGWLWLVSSAAALIVIQIGRSTIRKEAEVAGGQRCADCGYAYRRADPSKSLQVVVCWNCRFMVVGNESDCPRCFAGLTPEGRGITPEAFEKEQIELKAKISNQEQGVDRAVSGLQCPRCGTERLDGN